jgi:large subunit ribosomal protein L18
MGTVIRAETRLKRKKRVRKKIRGTPENPRLCVYRSSKHIYAQIVDDSAGRTLLAASSLSKDLGLKSGTDCGNKKGAALVGTAIAKLALEKGIKRVVLDRNGFLYHGRVKALSEAARENGLEF